MCRLPNILEYLREPLQAGLGDRSPYVRKTCVMGIVKLFHVAPEFVEGTLTCTCTCVRVHVHALCTCTCTCYKFLAIAIKVGTVD